MQNIVDKNHVLTVLPDLFTECGMWRAPLTDEQIMIATNHMLSCIDGCYSPLSRYPYHYCVIQTTREEFMGVTNSPVVIGHREWPARIIDFMGRGGLTESFAVSTGKFVLEVRWTDLRYSAVFILPVSRIAFFGADFVRQNPLRTFTEFQPPSPGSSP